MRKEIDPELYNYNKFPGPVFHQVGDQIRSENLSFELLKNVDQRLHLQFGEAYHMEIDSKANSYTKITLYLPLSSSDEHV